MYNKSTLKALKIEIENFKEENIINSINDLLTEIEEEMYISFNMEFIINKMIELTKILSQSKTVDAEAIKYKILLLLVDHYMSTSTSDFPEAFYEID